MYVYIYVYIATSLGIIGSNWFMRGTNMYIRNKIEYKVAFMLGAMSNAT